MHKLTLMVASSLMRVAEGGGAVVNERPVDVQSRTVTEPQRDVARRNAVTEGEKK